MLKAHFLAQLDREISRSRKVLQEMPDAKGDWKPHEKSMAFEYLAHLVATIPSWIAMQVTMPELDLAPKEGSSSLKYEKKTTGAEFVRALDQNAADARKALSDCTEEHLATLMATEGGREGRAAGHARQHDPGLAQSLVASPGTDDGVLAAARREGAVDVRTFG